MKYFRDIFREVDKDEEKFISSWKSVHPLTGEREPASSYPSYSRQKILPPEARGCVHQPLVRQPVERILLAQSIDRPTRWEWSRSRDAACWLDMTASMETLNNWRGGALPPPTVPTPITNTHTHQRS